VRAQKGHLLEGQAGKAQVPKEPALKAQALKEHRPAGMAVPQQVQ
jgi:hypothetical protein